MFQTHLLSNLIMRLSVVFLIAINAANISIIGGVFTLEGAYRKKGYASQVVGAISNFVIDNNRIPMLFYHNEKLVQYIKT